MTSRLIWIAVALAVWAVLPFVVPRNIVTGWTTQSGASVTVASM